MIEKYLMSSAQKRIYAIEEFHDQSIAYNVPMVFEVEGQIDVDRLESAFQKLCQRHEVFRTSFAVENENFIQIIEPDIQIKLQQTHIEASETDTFIREFVRPFDLSAAPLIRAGIANVKDSPSIFIVDIHHIVFDGASAQALLNDLSQLYKGETPEPLELQYKDFAAWHNEMDFEEQESYWLNQHSGETEAAELTSDFPRVAQAKKRGQYVINEISSEMAEQVSQFCASNHVTEYVVFLTALNMLISRYGNADQAVIGTVASGRAIPEVQDMIGMFVNTLAIRSTIEPNKSFHELLTEAKYKFMDALDCQDYPFDELVRKLGIGNHGGRNPLFDIMFSYEMDEPGAVDFESFKLWPRASYFDVSKFDLTLTVIRRGNGLEINWEYDEGLFKRETIERLSQHFIVFLNNCLKNPDQKISQISNIDSDEREQVLSVFNRSSDSSEATDQTVVQLFEAQAVEHAEKTAVLSSMGNLTYEQLNRKANCIATQLKNRNIGRGQIVSIYTNRSPDMICGIIGILKAGAVYLPIDPNYPAERVKYLLSDSNTAAVLLDKCFLQEDHFSEIEELIAIDSTQEAENVCTTICPNDGAYMIYTSGTTGMPKGVEITHQSLTCLAHAKGPDMACVENSVMLQKSTYVFDASVFEIFIALLSGSTLQLLSEDENNDFGKMLDLIEENQVTHTLMIPTVFDAVLDYMRDSQRTSALNGFKKIYLGAEEITNDLLTKYVNVTGRRLDALVNLYGPTECTVCATSYDFVDHVIGERIPIGRPLPRTQIYIVRDEQLCGIGMPGEICIAGTGLAKKYQNREELTSEKFAAAPFDKTVRLYRTGDIGQWRADGLIDYMGRKDNQVKIRGFRIELSEIETQIRACEGVSSAVVVLRQDGERKTLCAYLTGAKSLDLDVIEQHLRFKLPEYMIPHFMMQIEAIPVTINGKLDKQALPEPAGANQREFEAPTTEREKLVVQTLQNILAIESISCGDSYQALGGDSIKAIRIVSKIRDNGYDVHVRDIMGGGTIRNIASRLKRAQASNICQEPVQGDVPWTPIHKFFYDSNMVDPHHFNQSVILESRENIDATVLENALIEIVKHHDILRMTTQSGNQIVRPIDAEQLLDYRVIHIADADLEKQTSQILTEGKLIQSTINLEQGPLVKSVLFVTEERRYLWIIVHHLVVDGVSWRILLDDLNQAYDQINSGMPTKLPYKTSSFVDWGKQLKEYANSPQMQTEREYWENVNANIQSDLFKVPSAKTADKIEYIATKLDREITEKLQFQTGHAYGTDVRDILVTALGRAVYSLYNKEQVVINLESHGRASISPKLITDRTIGWFTAIYPAVLTLSDSLEKDIRTQKEMLRRIPNYGIGYGILAMHCNNFLSQECEITFNYLGEFVEDKHVDKTFDISDLENVGDVSEQNVFGSPVTINCSIVKGQLDISLHYHSPTVPKEVAQVIQEQFCHQLECLVEHCISQTISQKTASDHGELEWTDEQFQKIESHYKTEQLKIHRIIPLSPMQEGILYHKRLAVDSTNYVIQSSYRVSTEFCQATFLKTFELLHEAHPTLRTGIVYERVTESRQIVFADKQPDYKIFHFDGDESAYEAEKQLDIQRGFDLEQDTLLRVSIHHLSKDDIRLVFCFHHIVIDGWSFALLMSKLQDLYTRLIEDETPETIRANLKVDGVHEEHIRTVLSKERTDALKYWDNLLSDYEEPAKVVPWENEVPSGLGVEALFAELSEADSTRLCEAAKSAGVTLSVMLETAWGIVLQQYCNRHDIVFGKVVSGRNSEIKGIESAIGLFINTIPVRVQTDDQDTFRGLLTKIQQQSVDSHEFDYVPLLEVQHQSDLGSELVQSLFAFENYERSESVSDGLFTDVEDYREETGYPLSLSAAYQDQFGIKLMFDAEIYSEQEAQCVLDQLCHVLTTMANNLDAKVLDAEMVSAQTRTQMLAGLNIPEIDSTHANQTVIDLLEYNAKTYGDAIAASYGEQQISYSQLWTQSENLACELMTRQSQGEGTKIVGLVCDRSIDMIIGIYGILRAGMTYLPISPSLPHERVRFMFEDSQVKVCVHNSSATTMVQQLGIDGISINQCISSPCQNIQLSKPCAETHAYIIYTSGTTGTPKGVVISHKSLMNLILWEVEYFSLNNESKILQQFAFIFDGAVFEIFPAVAAGAELVIVPDETKENLQEFLKLLPDTVLVTTPSSFKLLLEYAKENNQQAYIQRMKHIALAAEVFPNSLAKLYFEVVPQGGKLHNLYGPTETTVCATAYEVKNDFYRSVPIGTAIRNMSTYILQDNRLCGIGIPGELCVSGTGVAEGYLGQLELTESKFIKHPYHSDVKLYRTGDLAKINTEGQILYVGRVDDQVKIRGFRIEVGEVENNLYNISEVIDAVVVVKKIAEESFLCAYVVTKGEQNEEQIKSKLRAKLPEYMVPSYVMQIESIPQTRNGKIDKNALPEPEVAALTMYIAPQSQNEEIIAAAFAEVLELDQISVEDGFLQMGGHSLKATKLINVLAQQYQITIPLSVVMQRQTVRSIANYLDEADTTHLPEPDDLFDIAAAEELEM
ncbi:MAG: amino acid adenylation domain-containing protein [Oscillospiraceae bacterium]|nr:amino acid adenylation domain-containing protein [Oscillospiraceae bacterium]